MLGRLLKAPIFAAAASRPLAVGWKDATAADSSAWVSSAIKCWGVVWLLRVMGCAVWFPGERFLFLFMVSGLGAGLNVVCSEPGGIRTQAVAEDK